MCQAGLGLCHAAPKKLQRQVHAATPVRAARYIVAMEACRFPVSFRMAHLSFLCRKGQVFADSFLSSTGHWPTGTPQAKIF